ncbi:Zinc finger CCCH domain-containing protein 18 [Hibiscus syriacus]|uniref:Zinc finger CCCH domain-containing protein 18 n=1 Tax=Hibiscus syriacus TaxID=106335 RepID=A0A6A2YGJ5_HIBSY|nr:zinc finger CCCH domain-containing protein 18-like isoform X2 [Hibiscus syriacus]KAE8676319.1 Zinc finger CCCH domain-containing protein 18 [Hibiscus syriacus]
MDFSESTKVVYNRIQQLEPENVSKIIGYLLLQDHGDRDMIRLAFCPDTLLHSLIHKAKSELSLNKVAVSLVSPTPIVDLPVQFAPYSPASTRVVSSPTAQRGAPSPFWDHPVVTAAEQHVNGLEFVPPGYSDVVAKDYRLQNQMHFLNMEDQLESANPIGSEFHSNYHYSEPALDARSNRRSPSLPEFPVKICHYLFNKGFCKHGNNCRYFHGHPMPESFSQIFNPGSNQAGNDDKVVSPGTLKKLELELTELLKARRGLPVSIASLPMLYYEKYGRTLQAEGYLTESQRHGKAGYSLTKLLARLKNSIRLIDRPHGQHAVILAEDAPKYAPERNDPGAIVAGSRQIYLTFPADSTFTEQDVSHYFNKFGLVQDVRIPCQQKRMFGFVTFVYAETVKQILAKGNPHFVCGARVLVKPYREKSRIVDRKYTEKLQQPPMYYCPHFIDGGSELQSMPRVCDNSRLFRKQLIEDREQALEFESRLFSELQLAPNQQHMTDQFYFGYSMDELKHTDDHAATDFPTYKRFNYLLDVLNTGSTSEDKVKNISTNYNDQDSQGLNLPESPFASPIGSGISTVI